MPEQLSITAGYLARLLGGTLEGDENKAIREVANLDEAGSEALSWVGSPDFIVRASKSRAGVLLLPIDCPVETECTVIRVPDPDVAICEVLECLAPPIDRVPDGVDKTAAVASDAIVEGAAIGAQVYVGRGAVIGTGTQLHPGVYIGAEVKVGRDCVLWPNVVVRERVTIGDRVTVHPNSTIGADGFGYLPRGGRHLKIPQIGTVVIENDVEIGANSAVDRARSGITRIGRGTKIDNLVQIAHNVVVGGDCIIVGQCGIGGSASLGDNVIVGGQVAVVDHRRIGNGARIAARSLVTTNIADEQVVQGTPAVDSRRYLRQEAYQRRLPALMEQIRNLALRVEQLERREGGEP